jgi:hypothetical protein
MADGLLNPSFLYEELETRGLLPLISRQTERGKYDSDANRMSGNTPSTMAHELTHAAQWNLLMNSAKGIQEKKRSGAKVSSQENQFLDAMQKTYGESFGTAGQANKRNQEQAGRVRQAQLQSLYNTSGNPKYDSYRTSRRELEAFGVGDMTSMGNLDVKPHLNPTMAQEFGVLFELYKSVPEEAKQSFANKRQADLDWMRQRGYRDQALDPLRFEPFGQNPFAPTRQNLR